MRDVSHSVATYYYNYGLWVAQEQTDGTYRMVQEKLSYDEFSRTMSALLNLDINGWKIKK